MKLFLISAALFTVSLLRKGSLGQVAYSCDPSQDCSNGSSTLGSKVPNPENCSQYYLCLLAGDGSLYPSDNPESCSEGQYFDWNSGDCIDDEGASCKNLCINLCETSCSSVTQMVADPSSCGSYFYCTDETDEGRIEAPCPDDAPYFDGTQCQNDTSKCCDTCTPYCNDIYIETRDPTDCTTYYLCTSRGIPDYTDLHECDSGQYFDPDVGRCVVGDACSPLCP
ncbi:UNVERIFIED_CONTAM: hypothetical protein RMT77_010375 [Armadillidium vulgare]